MGPLCLEKRTHNEGKGKRHSAEALCLCVCGRLASGYVKRVFGQSSGITGLADCRELLPPYIIILFLPGRVRVPVLRELQGQPVPQEPGPGLLQPDLQVPQEPASAI